MKTNPDTEITNPNSIEITIPNKGYELIGIDWENANYDESTNQVIFKCEAILITKLDN